MTRIPDVNSINWGESLTKFLTQVLDPETGSLNIWTDESRPGGITGIAGLNKGKCGWNLTKGCLERFDGNRWTELRSHIREVPTPLITSSDNTIPNTEWVTQRINKVMDDFITGTLDAYISNRVKEIVRDEIIPEVNLIMQTYRTLHDIARSTITTTEPSISTSKNLDDSKLVDVHISFDESTFSPVGIYVSHEQGVWMGYDRFLSKDLRGNTLISSIKGQQGLYFKSGTLQSVSIEPTWVLHLVNDPNSITPNNFQASTLTITTPLTVNSLID